MFAAQLGVVENSWKVKTPPAHVLSDVPADGRCLYRSLALVTHSTWEVEYAVIQDALRTPNPTLISAWHDTVSPGAEAARLVDADHDKALPSEAWPGAQAILAWAVNRTANVSVASTTGANLEFNFGPDDLPWVHLAYNGHHYRPFVSRADLAVDHGLDRVSAPGLQDREIRNKLLNTQFRKMENIAYAQDWAKGAEDGLCDEELPTGAHTGTDLKVWFANINSLASHLDAVLDIVDTGADVIGLSEHCLAAWDTAATSSKLKDHN
eukprot:4416782-Amphidinium_carterae.1